MCTCVFAELDLHEMAPCAIGAHAHASSLPMGVAWLCCLLPGPGSHSCMLQRHWAEMTTSGSGAYLPVVSYHNPACPCMEMGVAFHRHPLQAAFLQPFSFLRADLPPATLLHTLTADDVCITPHTWYFTPHALQVMAHTWHLMAHAVSSDLIPLCCGKS